MRRDLGGAVRALALPTAALLGVAFLAPGRLELALRIFALVVAAAVVVLALRALDRTFPRETALDMALARRSAAQAPPSLARVENEVLLGMASAVDLHYRLVPRLRTIASGLLASRRNVSLAADSERAREILGDEVWNLVRSDRAAPEDRLAVGIAASELERITHALEAI